MDPATIALFNEQYQTASILLTSDKQTCRDLAHYMADNAISKIMALILVESGQYAQKNVERLEFPAIVDSFKNLHPELGINFDEIIKQHREGRNPFQHRLVTTYLGIRPQHATFYVEQFRILLEQLNLIEIDENFSLNFSGQSGERFEDLAEQVTEIKPENSERIANNVKEKSLRVKSFNKINWHLVLWIILLAPFGMITLSSIFPNAIVLNWGWVFGGFCWGFAIIYKLNTLEGPRQRSLKIMTEIVIFVIPIFIIYTAGLASDSLLSTIGWSIGIPIWIVYGIFFAIFLIPILAELRLRYLARRERQKQAQKEVRFKKEHPKLYNAQQGFRKVMEYLGFF
ncbi:MAG TPA: hypothetical protein VKK79_04205 [Candidatus Lokiarchaeia archaeon]|nr:hypothetical protein [Candidatus Lokiarchaeia archaeon]